MSTARDPGARTPTPSGERSRNPAQIRRLEVGFGAGAYIRTAEDTSQGERERALHVLGLSEQELARLRAPADTPRAEPLKVAIAAYLDQLRVNGKRSRTVHEYAKTLEDFAGFHGEVADLRTINSTHVSAYLVGRLQKRAGNHQKRPSRGEVSVARRCFTQSVLSGFFRWCQGEYGIKRNPVLSVTRPPRTVDDAPDHLDDTEVAQLFERAGQNSDPLRAMRDRTLLEFMTLTGVRVSEAAGVRLGDLHLRAKLPHVVVVGKGGGTRMIDLPPGLVNSLERWIRTGLRSVITEPRGDNPLFCNLDKSPGDPLTTCGLAEVLRRMFRRLAKDVRFQGRRYHPHALRHTYAIRLAMADVSIAAISAELGHKHIETTLVYQRFSRREKVELLKRSGTWDWNPERGSSE